jgi:methylated-DNA-protein-cysteine methyltransferase related protein
VTRSFSDEAPRALSALVLAVLDFVDAVPSGMAVSYGEVAAATGATPRQVGQILARHGDEVPWHRVVMADGTPARHLTERQTALLSAEGVPFRSNGRRVDLAALRKSRQSTDAVDRFS